MRTIIAPIAWTFHLVSTGFAFAGGAADEGFREVLMKTIPIAIVAFVVSGFFLLLLWKSLADEEKEGDARFTPRSRRRMLYLVLSLIGFGLIFGWMAFHAP